MTFNATEAARLASELRKSPSLVNEEDLRAMADQLEAAVVCDDLLLTALRETRDDLARYALERDAFRARLAVVEQLTKDLLSGWRNFAANAGGCVGSEYERRAAELELGETVDEER